MRELFLFDNQLTGQVPASVRNMTILTTLLLQGNLLTGPPGQHFTLEDEGGGGSSSNITFRNLQVVDIGDNKFSGTVPVEFFKLPRLR